MFLLYWDMYYSWLPCKKIFLICTLLHLPESTVAGMGDLAAGDETVDKIFTDIVQSIVVIFQYIFLQ